MKRTPEEYMSTIIIAMIALMIISMLWFISDAKAEINMDALAMIESSGRADATSFLGARYGRGKYQVSELLLIDYNRINHTNIQPDDLYDADTCLNVALWAVTEYIPMLLRHYGCEVTNNAILHSYNLGAKAYADGRRNYNYINKYNKDVWK